jgi:DNA-binding response OmpR family regulator
MGYQRKQIMINTAEPAKILIVDDDIASGIILEGYLQGCNYYIHIVDNGENALEWAEKIKPDLILLDIMMPGISGFEVCKRLKKDKTTQDIPVLFITSLSDPDSHKKAIESGAEGFIVKPLNADLIIAYVKLFARMKKDRDNAEQCLDSIKEIVGSSIHDLANVNFAVSGNLEMALLNHDQSENLYKYIKKALNSLKKGNKMLNKLRNKMSFE